jgi:chemotaxis protein histidine kinase CheA
VAVEIGDDLRGELRDMTDATARSRIEEGLLAVRAEGPAIADLDRLYRELHSLKGTFGFLGAALTQRVLHEIEDAIGLCKRRAADLSGTDRDPLVDALLAGIDHVWRLRDACLARGDEAAAGVAPLLPAWKAGLDTACHALAAAMDARSAGHDITSEF